MERRAADQEGGIGNRGARNIPLQTHLIAFRGEIRTCRKPLAVKVHPAGLEPATFGSVGRSTRPPKSVVSPKPFASLQRIASASPALHTLHILAAFTAFSSKFSDRTLTQWAFASTGKILCDFRSKNAHAPVGRWCGTEPLPSKCIHSDSARSMVQIDGQRPRPLSTSNPLKKARFAAN